MSPKPHTVKNALGVVGLIIRWVVFAYVAWILISVWLTILLCRDAPSAPPSRGVWFDLLAILPAVLALLLIGFKYKASALAIGKFVLGRATRRDALQGAAWFSLSFVLILVYLWAINFILPVN